MNKQTPIQFAKEFINDLKSNNFDYSKELEFVFNKDILLNDPNLTILKQELNKVGFDIFPTKNELNWTIKQV